MRLIIVRHGETEFNKSKLLQGQTPTSLSPAGRKQAALLAARLRDEHVEVIYSSDLPRAVETSEEIRRVIPVPLVLCADLRERSAGKFEGGPVSELRAAEAASGEDLWLFRPAGGESLADLETRVRRFCAMLRSRPARTVVVSSHRAFNRMLLKVLLKKDKEAWKSICQDNCCLSILQGPDLDRLSPEVMNCTDHLSRAALGADENDLI